MTTKSMVLDDAVASVFKALGNPYRLKIVRWVHQHHELSVTQLTEALKLSQSSVSQHLSVLKLSGVLSSRKVGQSVFYMISDEAIPLMVELCDSMVERGETTSDAA